MEKFDHKDYRDDLARDLKTMRAEEGGKEYAKAILTEHKKLDEYQEAESAHRHQMEQEHIKDTIDEKKAEFNEHIKIGVNDSLLAVLRHSNDMFVNIFGLNVYRDESSIPRVTEIRRKLKNKEVVSSNELKLAIKEAVRAWDDGIAATVLKQSVEHGFLSPDEMVASLIKVYDEKVYNEQDFIKERGFAFDFTFELSIMGAVLRENPSIEKVNLANHLKSKLDKLRDNWKDKMNDTYEEIDDKPVSYAEKLKSLEDKIEAMGVRV